MTRDIGPPASTRTTAGSLEQSILMHYRDDGPLARAVAAPLAQALRLPAAALTVLAAVPVVVVLRGDDPPVLGVGAALVLTVLVASAGRSRQGYSRLDWTVPPLLRLVEYGAILWIGVVADAVGPAFALLAAVAFCHYDTVYRLRHQRVPPPSWATDSTGGWDGRLLLCGLLLAAESFGVGVVLAGVLIGFIRLGESIRSWLQYSNFERPSASYADEEEEDE